MNNSRRNDQYVSRIFPPLPDGIDIHPKDWINKKEFIPESKEMQEEVKIHPIGRTEENLGKEIQNFYKNIALGGIKEESLPNEEILEESKKPFYCEDCDEILNSSIDPEEHVRSFTHIFMRNKEKPKKKYYLNESNKGYQILKYKLNWDENQGLGANNQGQLDPLKTRLKTDRKGLGAPSKGHPLMVTHFKPFQVPSQPMKRVTKLQKRYLEQKQKLFEEKLREEIFRDIPAGY